MSIKIDKKKIRMMRDELKDFCDKLSVKHSCNAAELYLAMQAMLLDSYKRWNIAKELGMI